MRNKAYKYRILPNSEQKGLIKKTFGCVRFVYNQMLAERKEQYEKYKEDKENLQKQKSPTPAKYKNEYPWLKEVDSLALANAQLNLNTAYQNFFRDKTVGFPKFKSKHKDKKTYTTNNQGGTIRLIDPKHIRLPKLKDVRIKLHRPLPEEVRKSASLTNPMKCCIQRAVRTWKLAWKEIYRADIKGNLSKLSLPEDEDYRLESVLNQDWLLAVNYLQGRTNYLLVSTSGQEAVNLPPGTRRVLGMAGDKIVTWDEQKRICTGYPGQELATLAALDDLLSYHWFVNSQWLVLVDMGSYADEPSSLRIMKL